MFRIGDFSRIARVSSRLLRFYDELGLLRPARVEAGTGYRYYTASQLGQLNRILVLKELGLSLEEVARVLGENISAAELRGMLLMRRTEMERALSAEAERLRHIETRIAQIDAEGRLSADDVVIRSEPEKPFLSVRRTVGSFAEARQMIGRLSQAVAKSVPPQVIGPLTAIAHTPEFEPDHLDVEIGFVLRKALDISVDLAEAGTMTVRTLPAVERMAACVRVGLPEHAHLVTAQIGRFVEANDYRLAGASREVFLQPPQPGQMDQSVVEMQFPIEKTLSPRD